MVRRPGSQLDQAPWPRIAISGLLHVLKDPGHRWRRDRRNLGGQHLDLRRSELAQTALGTSKFRPQPAPDFQWDVLNTESAPAHDAHDIWRLGLGWRGYYS